MANNKSLMQWSETRNAIMLATSVDEIKDIRDKAEAIRLYAKQAGETLEVQNSVAEIKIRAERRAGELLAEMAENGERAKQGGDRKSNSQAGSLKTLDDMGVSDNQSSQWQRAATIPEIVFEQHIADTKTKGKELTSAGIQRLAKPDSAPHVSHNSGENEWYTPEKYIDAAYSVMGGIDLDPASSAKANETVGAESFFTAEQNGLEHDWNGRVWMNPPYSQPAIFLFAEKMLNDFLAGRVKEACILVNNATETAWFQGLLGASSAVCFIKTRVRFIDKNGNPSGSPLQGQVILYLGHNSDLFFQQMSIFGVVLHHDNNTTRQD